MTSRCLPLSHRWFQICKLVVLTCVTFSPLLHVASAQEIVRTDDIVMGYIAPGQVADVTGYGSCFTSIGNRLTVKSDNSANVEPMFEVTVAANKVRITRNNYADGTGVYVCRKSDTIKGKVVSGVVSSSATIGKGLSCVMGLSNFRKERVNGGTVPASFRCAYDPSTGVVSTSSSDAGRERMCGYVCFDPNTEGRTAVTARQYVKIFSGTENIQKNLSCSYGTNYFKSTCSNVAITQAAYAPTSGAVVKGQGSSPGNCSSASFSYLCAKSVPACSDGLDNDGDGATDFPADFSCKDSQDNDEGDPKSQCQNGRDDDNDNVIDLADPGCSSKQDNDESDLTTQCQDGVDNDLDGATDFPSDFSCSSPTDNDETFPKAQCQNGQDDDKDGLTDLADPGCASKQDNDESDKTSQCQDKVDNDHDGAKDFPEDFSCSSLTDNDETFPKAQCQNGQDDDNDGLTDLADPGCSSKQDNDEYNPLPQCKDGKDNDGDGFTDYYHDPGCTSYEDNDESNPITQCQDGKDNDGDNLIDYPKDPGCSSIWDADEINPLTQCQNGKDDDGDGLIDWKDPGCSDPSDNDESNTLFQCQNGKDDDDDGLVDLRDPGCENNPCKDDETDPIVIKVTPIAECVDVNTDGTITAHFGYQNVGSATVEVPLGEKNFVSPDKADRGQPTTFFTGRVKNVFTAVFPSTESLRWTVSGTFAEATVSTARCEGSTIECIQTNNTATQQSLDTSSRRQRHAADVLANRIIALNSSRSLVAAAKSYKTLAHNLYLQQWQDIWGRFLQVSESCPNCAAIDKAPEIQTLQGRSRRLERISRQLGVLLKRARGGKLRVGDENILKRAVDLEKEFQAQSLGLPRFESACGG